MESEQLREIVKENNQLDWTKSEMEIISNIFKRFNKKYTIEEIFFTNNFAFGEINN